MSATNIFKLLLQVINEAFPAEAHLDKALTCGKSSSTLSTFVLTRREIDLPVRKTESKIYIKNKKLQ